MSKKRIIVRQLLLNTGRIILSLAIVIGLLGMSVPVVQAEDPSTGNISGTVVDTAGNPIAGISIDANDFATSNFVNSAQTGADGKYTLTLAPGSYRVSASEWLDAPAVSGYARQYATSTGNTPGTVYSDDAASIDITSENTQTINFVMHDGGAVIGRVTGSGFGVKNVHVEVLDANDKWINGNDSDDNGFYRVTNLPVGSFRVRFNTENTDYVKAYYSTESSGNPTPVTVQKGILTSSINGNLVMGAKISGTVTDDTVAQKPLVGVDVMALNWDTGDWAASAATDSNGNYSLKGLPAGAFRIQASACKNCSDRFYLDRFYPNTSDWDKAQALTLNQGAVLTGVNLAMESAGIISGKVTGTGGVALADIPVVAQDTVTWAGFGASSDRDGNYLLRARPGFYRLRTRLSDNSNLDGSNYVEQIYNQAPNQEEAAVIEVKDQQEVANKNFTLEKGGSMSGVISGQSGPLSGATVLAMAADGSRRSYGSQATGADGVFSLQGLPAGPYIVRAMHPGSQARFWGNQANWDQATPLTISSESTTSNVNISLPDELKDTDDPNTLTTRVATTLMDTYDPSSSRYVNQVYVLDQAFAGVTRIDPSDGSTIENLATYTSSDNGKSWTFTLRDGLKWSDGSPLTAADLRFGMLRSLQLDTHQQNTQDLLEITGAKDYNAGKVGADAVGIRLDTTDPTHVIHITLDRAMAFLPSVMSLPIARPVPQMLIQAYPDNWMDTDKQISSGPYRVVEYNANHALLRANPNFFNHDQVLIQKIELVNQDSTKGWASYRRGEVDTTALPVSEIEKVSQDEKYTGEYHYVAQQCTNYIGFNTNNIPSGYAPADPVKLRKALIEAVDRATFNQTVSKQPTAFTFIARGVIGYSGDNPDQYIHFDTAQAVADYVAAFAGTGHNGLPPMTLYYPTSIDTQKNAITYLANIWNQVLGTHFTAVGLSLDDYNPHFDSGSLFAYYHGWCSDYKDGYNFLSFVPSASNLLGNWNNDTYNSLLATARSTVKVEDRTVLYNMAEKIILKEDAVLMPLNSIGTGFLSRKYARDFGVGGLDYIADWIFSRSDSLVVGSAGDGAMSNQTAGDTFAPAGEGGSVTYSLPEGAFAAGTTLVHTGNLTNLLTGLPAGTQKTPFYFSIQAKNGDTPVEAAKDYTLSVKYSALGADEDHLIESFLALYYWDAALNRWVKDPNSQVDPVNHLITTTTRRQGDWLVLGVSWQSRIFMPLLRK